MSWEMALRSALKALVLPPGVLVLLLTGYLADEFFADSGGATDEGAAPFFGAEQVVVLSASSKTAILMAVRAAK